MFQADVVGVMSTLYPLNQWADSFPWDDLVAVVDRRIDTDSKTSYRILLTLALLRQELQCSAGEICELLQTNNDVRYACGLDQSQVQFDQPDIVCPDQLRVFENQLDESVLQELATVQAVVLGFND